MRKFKRAGALVAEMIRRPDHARRWFNDRMRGNQPIAEGLPWLSWYCVDFLREHVRPGMRVFEFGGGGSTVFFATRGCTVRTIETSEEWIVLLRNQIGGLASRVEFVQATKDEESDGVRRAYAALVHEGAPWDIILVDGWEDLRPDCAREASSCVAQGGIVIVDNTDFPNIAPAVRELQHMRQRRFRGMGTGRRSLGQTDVFFNDPPRAKGESDG